MNIVSRHVVARVTVIVLIVPVLWNVTMRLTWPADFLIAVIACLLFAYKFERQEEP